MAKHQGNDDPRRVDTSGHAAEYFSVHTSLPQPVNATPSSGVSRWLIWLAIVLSIAAFVRLHALLVHAYMLDECWSVEIATGRGSAHQHLPVNQIISPPPQFFSLTNAPPWWQIWTHMEVTHPPLYSMLLRGWDGLFGDTDYGGRLFSVLASLIAIAILFDTVRLQSGLAPAVWAGLLMATSLPQVEHARLTRSYTLLIAIALLAVNLVVRIQRLGASRQRLICLGAAILATLMTHYFSVGALLGLLVYCLWNMTDKRRQLLTAFASAGMVFAIIWGPWMWQQRHLFATDDPSTLFLTGDTAHHTRNTIVRSLMDPVHMLFPLSDSGVLGMLAMAGGAILVLAPFLPGVRRKNSLLTLWSLWIVGTIAIVAALDFFRGTDHLLHVRYTILAGPAVCALIPGLFAVPGRWRSILHPVAALAFTGCLWSLPDVYHYEEVDPRRIAADFITRPGPDDLLVFAAPQMDTPKCEIELFMLARCMRPLNCPLLVLTHPPDADLLARIRQSHLIFLDMQEANYAAYCPGAKLVKGRTYRNLGNVFTLRYSSPGK